MSKEIWISPKTYRHCSKHKSGGNEFLPLSWHTNLKSLNRRTDLGRTLSKSLEGLFFVCLVGWFLCGSASLQGFL